MKRALLILAGIFLQSLAFGQNAEEGFWDGKIYFKVRNGAPISLPDYNGQEEYQKDFTRLINEFGITKIVKPFTRLKSAIFQKTYQATFSSIYKVNELIHRLQMLDYIEYAEKIPIEKLFYNIPPNDYNAVNNWGLSQINAPGAWSIFPTTSGSGISPVKIAIIDNEINTLHPDFYSGPSTVIWKNLPELYGTTGVDDDGNGYIDDINGYDVADNDNNTIGPVTFNHGTHVAGIACAYADNGAVGIPGMSFNAQLMAVKITPDTSSGTDIPAAWLGVEYAIANHADVINISWGASCTSGCYSITYQNMMDMAYAENITVVAAAGNSNTLLQIGTFEVYPAMYNHVITVGATGRDLPPYDDQISTISNYGLAIDVMAPGYEIYSTLNAGGYGTLSGTSMAAPLVAGLCGLMKSYNAALSPDAVANCIYTTCDNISGIGVNASAPFAGNLGNGRINAANAMACLQSPPVVSFSSNVLVTCPGNPVQFFNTSGGAPATSYSWSFPGGTPSTSTVANPVVSYITPGTYNVSLTVTNSFGSNMLTVPNYITVDACVTPATDQGWWFFGNTAAMHFSTGIGVGVDIPAVTMNTVEAAACYSDPITGNLLFYTDGQDVFKSDHSLMNTSLTQLNGSPNTPNSSGAQAALILPKIADPDKYYIFTVSDAGTTTPVNYGLCYTIVDMTVPGGSIASLNTPAVPLPGVNPKTTEHLMAVPHCNGTDYWIITHGAEGAAVDSFLVYHLSASGLSAPILSPAFNVAPFSIPFAPTWSRWLGCIKVSPDGKKIAVTTGTYTEYLYHFDNQTGLLTAASTITLPTTTPHSFPYGASFSPNSNQLYLTHYNKLYQYDVSNLNAPVQNSVTPALSPTQHRMQLGPDDRIYITSATTSLGIINYPDNSNNGSNAIGHYNGAVSLAGQNSLTSLPNVMDAKIINPLSPAFVYTLINCTDVMFNTNSCAASYTWDFGDGTIITTSNPTPVHTYTTSGSFTVTLTTGFNSHSETVVILPTTIPISGPVSWCTSNNVPATYITSTYPGYEYNWTANTGGLLTPDDGISIQVAWTGIGTNTVNIAVTQDGCTVTGALNVTVHAAPLADAGSNIDVCSGSMIGGSPAASGGLAPYTYLWSPAVGLSSSTISNPVASPGISTGYTLTVTDANGCTSSDFVGVSTTLLPVSITPPSAVICSGGSTTLTASGATTYTWSPSTGLNTTSGSVVIASPSSTTTYTVTGTDTTTGCIGTSVCTVTVTQDQWHQTTENSLGSEIYNDVITDHNGNVYVVGTYTLSTTLHGAGNPDMPINSGQSAPTNNSFVAKYDACGNLIWVANSVDYPGTTGVGIALDENAGMVYVTGNFNQIMRISSAASYNNLCTVANTLTIFTSGSNRGYVAQFDMHSGCLYFLAPLNLVSSGPIECRAITTNQGTGHVYVGGQYKATSTGRLCAFVLKYVPTTTLGTANTLNPLVWSILGDQSQPGFDNINDLDYHEASNTIYGIGNYSIKTKLLPGSIIYSGPTSDAFICSYTDLGSSCSQVLFKKGGVAGSNIMFGEGIAIDNSNMLFFTGTYKGSVTNPFNLGTGIPSLGAVSTEAAYMIGFNIGTGSGGWSRNAVTTSPGKVFGREVTCSAARAYFTGEFSKNPITVQGVTPALPYTGTFNSTNPNYHVFTARYSAFGTAPNANVTTSDPGEVDYHFARSITADYNGHCFVVGQYSKELHYYNGTPASGPLISVSGASAYVLRTLQSTGEYKITDDDIPVSVMTSLSGVTVYPNPTNSTITLEIQNFEMNTSYQVYLFNAMGQVIESVAVTSQKTTIDLSAYENGMYLLSVSNGTENEIIRISKTR